MPNRPICVQTCAVRTGSLLLLGIVLLAIILLAAETAAQESLSVMRVEEDWELMVATPDANSTAPQVTCVISPTQDTISVHAAFELNHQSQPSFVSGGLQLQVWEDEIPLSSHKAPLQGVLSTHNETITWTQAMSISSNTLTFEVINGTSTTWGSFGGQGYLKGSLSTTLANLDGYNPQTSVESSGIGYAANRVTKLTLKRVRITMSDGQVFEDTTERVVYPQN